MEQDIKQLQQNIRYRKIDTVDCVELICAVERLQNFNDFVKSVDVIFNIGGFDYGEDKAGNGKT